MPARIHFSPLGSGDAGKVSRLQGKLFPPELTEPESEIAEILRNTEQHMVCNFSFGLFDGLRLVGYVFAYVESESIFHHREEEVVYIKEVALSPGYEHYLRPLFGKLAALCFAFTPDTALEAHVQDDTLRKWRRLARFFKAFGLSLSIRDEPAKKGRPPYKIMRLESSIPASVLSARKAALPGPAWRHGSGLTLTVVSNPAQWLSLKDGWEELLRQTPDSNVFQSFDYLWEWWRHFGFWNELRILVIREGAQVIGVAPLMLEHFPIFGRIVRKLMFITAPMEMSRPKFIFGTQAEACLPVLLGYLRSAKDSWDVFDIDEQLHDNGSRRLREHFGGSGCLVAESETLCPYIDIASTWEDFLAGRSRKLRSNINRLRRKLAETGEVQVRKVSGWPALDRALDLHCEVELRSWKAARHLHISADKSHYFFYKALGKCFGRAAAFELRLLECDGKALASTFGIVRDGVFQSLKIAHDSACDKLSPGTVLESYELEDLFRQGVARYEFMGSFLANKLRWTSTVCRTTNIHVYQKQPRLALFFFVFFVFKRRMKAVLKRTGQFERAERFLRRFGNNTFLQYQ